MILLFSRPPEVPGILAIILTFVVFGLITATCAVSVWVFSGSNHDRIKSYLTGFTFVGLILLVFQVIVVLPVLIVFFYFNLDVILPMISSNDGVLFRFDNFLTYFWLLLLLIFYGLIVKFLHRKFYQRYLNWKQKSTK